MHDQDARCRADLRDGRDVAARIVRQALVEPRSGRDRDVVEEKRIAVARRLRDDVRAERTTGARAVVDDERLAKLLPELLPENARNEIARAARRKRDDDANGFGGV